MRSNDLEVVTQLVEAYFELLDAKRAHKQRCLFPREAALREAETKLRAWSASRRRS